MASKKERMILEARKELAKKGKSPTKEPTDESARPEKPPSMMSGVILIFIGSFAFSIFLALDQILLGFLASAAFIIIGMFRIMKANAAKYKQEKMPKDS